MKTWTSPAMQELDVKLTANGNSPADLEQYILVDQCFEPTTYPSTSECERPNCSCKSGVAS